MVEQETNETMELPREIERKFLVKSLPSNFDQHPSVLIKQGYVEISSSQSIRYRQEGDKFFQTIKAGPSDNRVELEMELSKDQFDQMWPKTAGQRLSKTRFFIPVGENIADLDIYQGELDELLTVEVEFKTAEEKDQFAPPDWFGQEVTDDPSYSNYSLATNGLPV